MPIRFLGDAYREERNGGELIGPIRWFLLRELLVFFFFCFTLVPVAPHIQCLYLWLFPLNSPLPLLILYPSTPPYVSDFATSTFNCYVMLSGFCLSRLCHLALSIVLLWLQNLALVTNDNVESMIVLL